MQEQTPTGQQPALCRPIHTWWNFCTRSIQWKPIYTGVQPLHTLIMPSSQPDQMNSFSVNTGCVCGQCYSHCRERMQAHNSSIVHFRHGTAKLVPNTITHSCTCTSPGAFRSRVKLGRVQAIRQLRWQLPCHQQQWHQGRLQSLHHSAPPV